MVLVKKHYVISFLCILNKSVISKKVTIFKFLIRFKMENQIKDLFLPYGVIILQNGSIYALISGSSMCVS